MSIASVSGRNRVARLVAQSKPDLSPYRVTYNFIEKHWLVVTNPAGDVVQECDNHRAAEAACKRLNNQ